MNGEMDKSPASGGTAVMTVRVGGCDVASSSSAHLYSSCASSLHRAFSSSSS